MIKSYLLIFILTIIMVIAVVFGIGETGSPFEVRQRKFDEQRVTRLSGISSLIETSYISKQKLPNNLNDLDMATNYYGDTNIKLDPETNKEFEYHSGSGSSYQLCANFSLDSKDVINQANSLALYPRISGQTTEKFKHPKGFFCFDLNANRYNQSTTYLPSPVASPAPLSSVDNSTPICTTLGGLMIVQNGKGTIGCDIKVTGSFDLSKSFCQGQASLNTQNLRPDAYQRSNQYYATLNNLDPKEEVKVYIYSNSGQKIECTPSLNKS